MIRLIKNILLLLTKRDRKQLYGLAVAILIMGILEIVGTGQKTIIMIAHRLTTVKACDVIYMMEKGCIIAQGDYETLLTISPKFREMAQVVT
jgi:ABC-type transport system involved in cytochrome bd biosynthesis fused ATPase/permease subunit